MDDATTFDARVYQTEVYRGREVTTYKVRWKVGGSVGTARKRGHSAGRK